MAQHPLDHKVFIVDDDAGVRDALSWLLRTRRLLSDTFDSAEAFLDYFSLPYDRMDIALWAHNHGRPAEELGRHVVPGRRQQLEPALAGAGLDDRDDVQAAQRVPALGQPAAQHGADPPGRPGEQQGHSIHRPSQAQRPATPSRSTRLYATTAGRSSRASWSGASGWPPNSTGSTSSRPTPPRNAFSCWARPSRRCFSGCSRPSRATWRGIWPKTTPVSTRSTGRGCRSCRRPRRASAWSCSAPGRRPSAGPASVRTTWRLGFQVRRVLLFACETLLPKVTPLLQT